MKNLMIIAVVTVFCGICFSSATVGVVQDKQASLEKKIVELKSKRRDTFKLRLEALKKQSDMGEIGIGKLISARDDLYQAELDLATDKTARVKLCEQRFENMVNLEKAMEQRHANGVGSFEEKLLATAARLQAEIEFLTEQAAD